MKCIKYAKTIEINVPSNTNPQCFGNVWSGVKVINTPLIKNISFLSLDSKIIRNIILALVNSSLNQTNLG